MVITRLSVEWLSPEVEQSRNKVSEQTSEQSSGAEQGFSEASAQR